MLEAAAQLGYLPNASARALRAGRSFTLALLATDVHHPFFASVLDGAEAAARPLGYAVLLVSMHETDLDWRAVIARALATHTLDGFILFAHHDAAQADVEALGRKAVLVEASEASVPTLQLDIATGFSAVVGHLLDLGHSHIAHLAADYPSEIFRVQQRIYRQAVAELNMPPVEDSAIFNLDEATAAAGRLLDGAARPSAILCDDDLLAAGVYKAAHARGLRIPHDLSVTGFCDIQLCRMLEPELTTVHIPAETIGKRAVQLLVDWIERERKPGAQPAIELSLVVRGSTTPRTSSR